MQIKEVLKNQRQKVAEILVNDQAWSNCNLNDEKLLDTQNDVQMIGVKSTHLVKTVIYSWNEDYYLTHYEISWERISYRVKIQL